MQMRGRGVFGPAPRPPGLRGSCSAAGTVKVAPIGRDGESARRCGRGRGHREPQGLPLAVRPRRRRGCAPLVPFPACARLRQLASCAAEGGRREERGASASAGRGEERREEKKEGEKKEKREGRKGGNLPLLSLENDT